MKKLIYLLLPIWMMTCWGCGSESDDPGNAPSPAPQEKIEVSTPELVMDEKEGTETVSITSSAAWTANSSSLWCTVSPASGAAGTHTLTIKTASNHTYDERNATISIQAGKASKAFTVKQKQKDALTASSAKNEFAGEGGELVIE